MLNAFFLKSKLLRMSGILLVILSFCIPAFSASLEALGIEQKKVTVNGVVLDDTREPLIGVSVLVKGSQQGTVTDLDGKYSITAPADGILICRNGKTGNTGKGAEQYPGDDEKQFGSFIRCCCYRVW